MLSLGLSIHGQCCCCCNAVPPELLLDDLFARPDGEMGDAPTGQIWRPTTATDLPMTVLVSDEATTAEGEAAGFSIADLGDACPDGTLVVTAVVGSGAGIAMAGVIVDSPNDVALGVSWIADVALTAMVEHVDVDWGLWSGAVPSQGDEVSVAYDRSGEFYVYINGSFVGAVASGHTSAAYGAFIGSEDVEGESGSVAAVWAECDTSFNPPAIIEDARITEDGEYRITEDGQVRIIE